jgi:hypothetical protein
MARVVYEAPKANAFELIPHMTPVIAVIEEAKNVDGTKKNGDPWYRTNFTAKITEAEDETLIGRKIWDGFWLPGDVPGLVNLSQLGDNPLYIAEGDPIDTEDEAFIEALVGTTFAANIVIDVQKRKKPVSDKDGNVTVTQEETEVNQFQREAVKWNAQLMAYPESDYGALVRGVTLADSLPFRTEQ